MMADLILTITCFRTNDGFRWTIADRHGYRAERDTPAEIVLLALEILEAWRKEKGG